MVRPKHPCVQDCPNRTAACHGKCEKYSVYEARIREFYDEKAEIIRGKKPIDRVKKIMDLRARRGKKGSYPVWGGE